MIKLNILFGVFFFSLYQLQTFDEGSAFWWLTMKASSQFIKLFIEWRLWAPEATFDASLAFTHLEFRGEAQR